MSTARFITLSLKLLRETVKQLEQIIWLLVLFASLLEQQVIYLHHFSHNEILELTVLSLRTNQLLKALV
jgi:hypothetical protein